MDKVDRKTRSFIMSRIRSKDTQMELLFAKELRKHRLVFHRNVCALGKPDFVLLKSRVVVFLDSCFWHHCPYHFRAPKSRTDYWVPKIRRNVERDKRVRKEYRNCGWHVARFWEHQIRGDIGACAKRLLAIIEQRSRVPFRNIPYPDHHLG